MERDCESWYLKRHLDSPSYNLNSISSHFNLVQQQNSLSAYVNMVIPNETIATSAFSQPPRLQAANTNEPHGSFYGSSRYPQAFAPIPNFQSKEKLLVQPHGNIMHPFMPKPVSGSVQKSFLVFDQTGDQTTMIFSSGTEAPLQLQTSLNPIHPITCNFMRNEVATERESIYHSGKISTDKLNEEEHPSEMVSEMHEDTEELNALLYSDDDSDYTEDDEVTSTWHAPSTITFFGKQDLFNGCEEVASSNVAPIGPKLGSDFVPSSTVNRKRLRCSKYEDDEQSSYANVKHPGLDEVNAYSRNKKMKEDKIREIMSILESIIPGGKGKDENDVLDKAIEYLNSLKLQMKNIGFVDPL